MPVKSDPELLEWLELLHPTTEGRKRSIANLLAHAAEDGMTVDDRTDCLRGLQLLSSPQAPPQRVPPRVLDIPVEDLETEH